MQAPTVGGVRSCSCIDRRRLSCASTPPCIPPTSHPFATAGTVPSPPPSLRSLRQQPLLLCQSLSLPHPSPLLLSPLPIHHPVISPRAHPFLSQAESRTPCGPDLAQPPNQRRRHGDAVRTAPVNVTLKTEGVHVHTYSDGCAVRGRASARGAILYIHTCARWTLIN